MSLFLHNAPVGEFITWFNQNYETPPVAIQFTVLGEEKSHYDHNTWTIWIDIRQSYQDIVDRLGYEAARCLSVHRDEDIDSLYAEIKERWGEYVVGSLSTRETLVRRKIT